MQMPDLPVLILPAAWKRTMPVFREAKAPQSPFAPMISREAYEQGRKRASLAGSGREGVSRDSWQQLRTVLFAAPQD